MGISFVPNFKIVKSTKWVNGFEVDRFLSYSVGRCFKRKNQGPCVTRNVQIDNWKAILRE